MRPRTMTAVILSTAHLSPDTLVYLNATSYENWPVFGGPISYGYFFNVPQVGECPETPADLEEVFAWCRIRQHSWVRFDCDEEEIEGLKIYEHDTPAFVDKTLAERIQAVDAELRDIKRQYVADKFRRK